MSAVRSYTVVDPVFGVVTFVGVLRTDDDPTAGSIAAEIEQGTGRASIVASTSVQPGRSVLREDAGMDDRAHLEVAKAHAREGRAEGGIPIGAALVANDGTVLGAGHNRRVQMGSAIRHGETDALERAGRLPAEVYAASTMYTTLSPCSMCTGAILLYGIPRVVIGEHRTFMGEEELLISRGVEVVVLDDPECVAMMDEFIVAEPALWNEDIGEPTTD